MGTYYTKCGFKFQKSTKAETTGFHIASWNEKGARPGEIVDSKCAACPFVIDVKEGCPEQKHKRFECRAGSRPPNHENSYRGSAKDKNTLQVDSLDHDFCEAVIAFARNHPELSASYNVDHLADCRRTVSVNCSGNKRGMAAKAELIARFFTVTADEPAPTFEAEDEGDAMPDADPKAGPEKKEGYRMIQNIDIKKISPHPDNPRKDLGDLSELAASIKSQGVLQNLTVVPESPGYCKSCGLYNWGVGKCVEDHDLSERPPCSKWESRGNYTVIIGHRRLTAAKLAGLTEVPCMIATMTPQEQVAAMLLENMQRSDLTVYEQAQGFQMMLDFGETASGISEKTGFSETTVRTRVKLLDFDKDKFRKACDRGATLNDYARLNKIQDPELRNQVLDAIGTKNFDYQLQRAIDQEKEGANRDNIIAAISEWAEQVENDGQGHPNRRYVMGYHFSSKFRAEDLEKPDDTDTVRYFFTVNSYAVCLYEEHEQTPEELAAEEKKQQEVERREQICGIAKRAFELRKDFVLGLTPGKKHIAAIMAFAVRSFCEPWSNFSRDEYAKLIGIDRKSDDAFDGQLDEKLAAKPEYALLLAAYNNSNDTSGLDHVNYNLTYKKMPRLDTIYQSLESLGYEMSDEEQAWHNGTHELFQHEQ